MARTTSSQELIRRYLQDAIASERAFESQLKNMAEEGDDPAIQQIFSQHLVETKRQHDRLVTRLEQLGESPSTMKSVFAHVFSMMPKGGQMGQSEADKNTQNLLVGYAVEQSEVASYEALKVAAEMVGDVQTASLAEEIQREEQATAQKIWNLIPRSARAAVERQTSDRGEGPESFRRGKESGSAATNI